MAFKMKGPGLPGFRKNAGSGFYKGSGFNINTSNRSPIKQDNEQAISDGELANIWNTMPEQEKAGWIAKGMDYDKWSTWQLNEAGNMKSRWMKKKGEEYEGPLMPNEEYQKLIDSGWTEPEIYQDSFYREQLPIENKKSTPYSNMTLQFKPVQGQSADDGTRMLRIYDPNTGQGFGMLSTAEFHAKYIQDGDLKMDIQATKHHGDKTTGTLYMSEDFLENHYNPMIKHYNDNLKRREEFIQENEGSMSKEELNARLNNDASLRLDVAGLNGFNKPIYGTGKVAEVDGAHADPSVLKERKGLFNRDGLSGKISQFMRDNKLHGSGSYAQNNSVMPYNPDDYTIDDSGNVVGVEGANIISTDDWINELSEFEKRKILKSDDKFDKHHNLGYVTEDGESAYLNAGTQKEFFANLYDKQTNKLDFSQLEKNQHGDYILNGRVIGDKNDVMQSLGLGSLNNDIGRSLMSEFSSDFYREEMEGDTQTTSPDDVTLHAENRHWDSKNSTYVDKNKTTRLDGKKVLNQTWNEETNSYDNKYATISAEQDAAEVQLQNMLDSGMSKKDFENSKEYLEYNQKYFSQGDKDEYGWESGTGKSGFQGKF